MANETEHELALEQIRDEIGRSIQAYYDLKNHGDYVTGWVVIAERTSIELEQKKQNAAGPIVPDGQSFITTRGLLDVEMTRHRAAQGNPV